ncbi:MAG TPA: MBL fold metallo-hydrolase [Bacillota bacterium]|nr:MBL fold metallo-hydrolase [Bacillota bacterium]HQI16440.1 MBL fold metallo-hydrolase [Bacillota bacterium]HQJ36928.1 MBL fold metallo-hydrolase [Bacillota bacterium]HRS20281.1 MBL fold metallo-hydrolase [Clostridia bacterium]HRU41982.1 MBL fold metallo-hydrolase [Candidatus Diapherotrites archaeon]
MRENNACCEAAMTSEEKRMLFYSNPSIAYCKPFRIFGNLYYIGDKKVCSHLIDTGEGLIVFDSGYQHTIHLLVQSIWELGFNPSNIKYLIHTHGHFDHFGGSNEFRTLYGCKTIMSRPDAEMLRDNPDGALMEMNPNPYAKLPIIDQTFGDGDIITLGSTSIRCVIIPGHSPGNTAFFFDVRENNCVCHVAYFGGAGNPKFITLQKDYLDKCNLPYSLRDDFINSIDKLYGERADIVLGSHPSQNRILEKRKLMLEQDVSNPFIDPFEWDRFLSQLKESYISFLDKGI